MLFLVGELFYSIYGILLLKNQLPVMVLFEFSSSVMQMIVKFNANELLTMRLIHSIDKNKIMNRVEL